MKRALFLVVVGVASVVSAHAERYPKRDALTVEPTQLKMTIDYAVPRGDPARALRGIFDRDHSGTLDDKEREALRAHLEHEALAFLRLALDGKDVRLATHAVLAETSGEPADRLSVHVELVAPIALGAGDHKLRVADRHKDRRITVPLAVTLGEGITYRARPPVLLTVDEGRPALLEIKLAR